MHVHLHLHQFHVRHWVLWWFCVGVVLGLIAVVYILERHLQRAQDATLVIFFAVFWALSGVVCYAIDDAESRFPPHR